MSAEIREIERRAFTEGRVSSRALMAQAGAAVAKVALAVAPEPAGLEAVVLVGPGNNGGDGLVVAGRLVAAGMTVTLWRHQRDAAGNAPVAGDLLRRVVIASNLASLDAALDRAVVVIDALFGVGQRRDLPAEVVAALKLVNDRRRQLGLTRVAVDVPTGVNADDGAVRSVAFAADVTVTLGRPKRGLYVPPGFQYAGRIVVDDLGLVDDERAAGSPRLIDRSAALARLPRRDPGAHKGAAGTLLIVGGSERYPSAPGLAAEAALRAGAGLVTLAAPRGAVAPLAARVPEATFLPLSQDAAGDIDPAAVTTIEGDLERFTAVLLGNGLGQSPGVAAVLGALLLGSPANRPTGNGAPLVIDADGLNWLTTIPQWWDHFRRGRLVLTPHPGEMARLWGSDTKTVTADPWSVARDAAARWGQVVVLKGGHTVVATPAGALWVAEQAHPALATAGTGDTLAGTIAGFLAQGLGPEDAAVLGLYVGGRAAELASAEVGVLPFVASDLPRAIGAAIRELEGAFA